VGDPNFLTTCLNATEDISEGQFVLDINLAHMPTILMYNNPEYRNLPFSNYCPPYRVSVGKPEGKRMLG
jgi:hypothetical protein